MTSRPSPELMDAARRWAIALADPAFDDWDGFTAWLEQDPAHVRAYDAASDADEAVVALFATPPAPIAMAQPSAAASRASRVSRRWVAGGGAVAAAIALFFVYTGPGGGPAGAPYTIATRAGITQTIDLEPGTQVVLNGDSQVTLDRERPRFARLDRGEALFVVRHDADRPFTVDVGEARLVDLGTVFNVVLDDHATRVAVSEGVVLYNPDRDAVRLDAGQALEASGGNVTVRSVAIDAVDGWRRGSLSYDRAPLVQVAADLSRNLGAAITLDPSLSGRRFSGTLAIDGPAEQVLPRIAPLLGGEARPNDTGWRVTPPGRAQP